MKRKIFHIQNTTSKANVFYIVYFIFRKSVCLKFFLIIPYNICPLSSEKGLFFIERRELFKRRNDGFCDLQGKAAEF